MTGLYFPEEEGLKLKCRYVDCAWGMGLAGRGICEKRGLWFSTHCPGYETDEELEEEWREEMLENKEFRIEKDFPNENTIRLINKRRCWSGWWFDKDHFNQIKEDNMPTGYTAKLIEQEQTFSEFIMTCARAFGALIMMREEPNDAPIPEKFEPTDYYAKCLIEIREKIIKLKSMTETEKITFGQSEKDKNIKQNEKWLEKDEAENKRLENMEAQVRAWKPPTQDHQGLKDFMLEQINISKNDLIYIQTLLVEAKKKPAIAYYVATISNAIRNIKYNTEENDKEIERVNKRNDWIRQLRESI